MGSAERRSRPDRDCRINSTEKTLTLKKRIVKHLKEILRMSAENLKKLAGFSEDANEMSQWGR